MHITLEADYAVRIVHCLAKNGGRMDAKRLAACTGVTLRFSLKILRKLVAEGIIRSFKGTSGGYELAKPPEEISLGQVIEVVEGPITISRCVGVKDFPCTRTSDTDTACRFHETYSELARMVRERLYSEHF